MALSDLTFKLYTDSGLTSEFSGLYQLTHETDLSDGDQDFTLYLGSLGSAGADTEDRQLQANSNPGVDDITLTPTDTLDDWEATTAYSLGQLIEPTTPNTYVYECTTAGTSAGSEPTFPTAAIGDTVTDGTVVWTMRGARHEVDEITLALSSGALDTNVAGDPLDVATTITSGSSNAVAIYLRVTNAVTNVRSNTGYPEIAVYINEVVETEV